MAYNPAIDKDMQTRATILCDLDCVALLADVHIHGAADGVAIRHVVLADVGLLHRQPHFPVALVVSILQRWEELGFKPFHDVYLLPFGLSCCRCRLGWLNHTVFNHTSQYGKMHNV